MDEPQRHEGNRARDPWPASRRSRLPWRLGRPSRLLAPRRRGGRVRGLAASGKIPASLFIAIRALLTF